MRLWDANWLRLYGSESVKRTDWERNLRRGMHWIGLQLPERVKKEGNRYAKDNHMA